MRIRPARLRACRHGATFALGAAFALAVTTTFAACGRKALPRPPQWVIPESPAPLEVSAVDEGTRLSWRRPTKYVDDKPLDDLGRFDVERTCLGFAWEKVAELEVGDRERFRRNRTFAWIDRSPRPDEPCHYRVTAWTLDGYASAPAEGWIGAPSPTPAPSPTSNAAGASALPAPTGSPGADGAVPAPLASPTPDAPALPAAAR